MKYVILLVLFVSSAMADVWYYGSGEAVNLENNIGFDKHSQKIITGDTDDPSVVAKNAAQGSIYLRSSGGVYFKTDNGSSTNWSLIPGSFSVSAPLSYALNNISIPKADATHDGYLAQGDWSTFNGKQNALTFGSVSTSTTGVTIGNGTNSTVGPNVTVDVQTASALQPGLLSAADWSTFNGKEPAQTKGSVSTSTTGVTIGSGSNSTVGPNVTVDVATASGTTTGLLTSGDWTTFNGKIGSLVVATKGDLLSFSTAPAALGVGTNGQILSADDTTATGLKWIAAPSFSGANTALSNLSSVAINESLVSDTNDTDDLGSAAVAWNEGYINKIIMDSNGQSTTIQPSASASTTEVYTLPATDGTNGQALVTDGNGVLSWANAGGSNWTVNGSDIYRNSNVGIGVTNPDVKLSVTGSIKLNGSTSGYIGIAPAAAAGSVTYTLPNADGAAGTVLSTDGSGLLSWKTDSTSGLPVSTLTTDTTATANNYYIADKAGSAMVLTLPSTCNPGDAIGILGKGSTGWTIKSNASATAQEVIDGANISDVSNSSAITLLSNSGRYDAAYLMCAVSSGPTIWAVVNKNGTALASAVAAPSTLHSYWRLDETSGNADNSKQSGSTYDLTQSGTVGSTTGKLNNGRGTFSDSDYFTVSLSNSSSTAYDTQTFMVEFWVKVSTTGVYQYITHKIGGGNGWFLRIESNNYLKFQLQGSTQINASFSSYMDGNWHYVACANRATSGTNETRCYVDNVLFGQASGVGYTYGSNDLSFGRNPPGNTGEYFRGYLDDIAFHPNINTLSWGDIVNYISERWNSGNGKPYN